MFERRIGKLLLTEEIPGEEIDAAVKITRNRLGHFHMHVPIATSWEKLPELKSVKERRVVALDPGVRTFQTSYSPNNDFKSYATAEGGYSKIYKLALKCDTCKSNLSNKELDPKKRKRLQKKLYLAIQRIRNLVDEVHKKVANDLCTNYDTILLPKFESQSMVKKKNGDRKRVIRRQTARMLLLWRHYAFQRYLASKVIMTGKELVIVTEEYTSKTCGCCGHINRKLGGSKTFRCPKCNFICGRDDNAARNIALKTLSDSLKLI